MKWKVLNILNIIFQILFTIIIYIGINNKIQVLNELSNVKLIDYLNLILLPLAFTIYVIFTIFKKKANEVVVTLCIFPLLYILYHYIKFFFFIINEPTSQENIIVLSTATFLFSIYLINLFIDIKLINQKVKNKKEDSSVDISYVGGIAFLLILSYFVYNQQALNSSISDIRKENEKLSIQIEKEKRQMQSHSSKCYNCAGRGLVHCKKGLTILGFGLGHDTNNDGWCSNCSNSGMKTCDSCNGTGR